MKHLRKFDSVSDMNTTIANSTIGIIGLAYNNGTPVMRIKTGSSPVPPTPSTSTPFYVEDVSGSDNTVQITKSGSSAPTLTIEKSVDGTNWESMGTTSTTAITATVPANGKLYLRCSTNAWGISSYRNVIDTTGNCNVGGNVMSLLYGSNFTGNETTFPSDSTYNFYNLFRSNTHLINASELILPATTLTDSCYRNLFYGCTSLTSAPVLPATTLATWCHMMMFYGCTSLTSAPALPATTLAENCYISMFQNCTSLTSAPALPATTLAQDCYKNMFSGCTSLTTAPALPATTLAQGCYYYMFSGCTSLTTAPALPATTLAQDCYHVMFYDCTSLTSAPALPATTLAQGCYYGMFGYCTALTTAPVLPATTLVSNCYYEMFRGCTYLNYIKCLATDISASNCIKNWVQNVAATGTFVKAASMSSWTTGTSGIPSGWTVEDATE